MQTHSDRRSSFSIVVRDQSLCLGVKEEGGLGAFVKVALESFSSFLSICREELPHSSESPESDFIEGRAEEMKREVLTPS